MTQPEQDRSEILIVDDNPDSLRILVEMLQCRGYRVRSATNGKRALQSAQKSPPELILLDVCMPDMTGLQVCTALKEQEESKDVPVLFISALDDTQDKLRAFEQGGVDYITKPFQEAEVLARIETQLTILRQRRKIEHDFRHLKQLEELRDGLTHMLVHDLRSPLTGIVGYAHLLQRMVGPRLQADELTWLNQIKDLTSHLIDMVSNILDVSRLEANNMPLVVQKVCLRTLANEAVGSLGAVEHTIEIVAPACVETVCDPALIRRVVANLTGNALRYSPPDQPVQVMIQQAGSVIETRVRDRGPGVPTEFQERIFEKFTQVERRGNHSGLGLTFCKLVVEKHAGKIGVHSQPGQGAEFWFQLPA